MKSTHPGCSEYGNITRRRFLIGAAQTAAIASAPAWLPKVAFARTFDSERDVLVSVYLRGGCDGLNLCVPHGDNAYYDARPTIAVPRPDATEEGKCTDLDGFFGFPPQMLPLLPAYQAGDLAIIHACGSPDPTRSHFDAQRFMEVGKAQDPNIYSGWLGRHLATVPPLDQNAILRAIGMDFGLQKILYGAPQTLPIPYPEYFGIWGDWQSYGDRLAFLREAYSTVQDPVKAAAEDTLGIMSALQQIDFEHYVPSGGAEYPSDDFGHSMKAAAAMLKADLGLEAIHVDIHGWDTHSEQNGHLQERMTVLAQGMSAFYADMFGSDRRNWTMVAMSEFGRNVGENASRGTDHGHGNCMFALGDKIAGGQVIRQWPGLAPEQLYQGWDLDVTIDYRDILAEIVDRRLGNGANLAAVFPDYAPTYRGLVTT